MRLIWSLLLFLSSYGWVNQLYLRWENADFYTIGAFGGLAAFLALNGIDQILRWIEHRIERRVEMLRGSK